MLFPLSLQLRARQKEPDDEPSHNASLRRDRNTCIRNVTGSVKSLSLANVKSLVASCLSIHGLTDREEIVEGLTPSMSQGGVVVSCLAHNKRWRWCPNWVLELGHTVRTDEVRNLYALLMTILTRADLTIQESSDSHRPSREVYDMLINFHHL